MKIGRLARAACAGTLSSVLLLSVTGAAGESRPNAARADGDGSDRPMQDRRFVLLSRTAEAGGADPTSAGLGEAFVFTDVLFDEQNREVGRSGGACTVVATRPRLGACHGSFRLPGGDLAVATVVDLDELVTGSPYRLAVVGGTGSYRHARGELTVTPPTDPREPFRIVADLR
jgi:hypothetical protein